MKGGLTLSVEAAATTVVALAGVLIVPDALKQPLAMLPTICREQLEVALYVGGSAMFLGAVIAFVAAKLPKA